MCIGTVFFILDNVNSTFNCFFNKFSPHADCLSTLQQRYKQIALSWKTKIELLQGVDKDNRMKCEVCTFYSISKFHSLQLKNKRTKDQNKYNRNLCFDLEFYWNPSLPETLFETLETTLMEQMLRN